MTSKRDAADMSHSPVAKRAKSVSIPLSVFEDGRICAFDDAEAGVGVKEIVIREQCDPVILRDMLRIPMKNEKARDVLNTLIPAFKSGFRDVSYGCTDYGRFKHDDHPLDGASFLGRLFARGASVQNLKSVYFDTLFADTHVDIDMHNCHFAITVQVFGDHVDIPTIEGYAANRDTYCKEFTAATGLPLKACKVIANAALNGGGCCIGVA